MNDDIVPVPPAVPARRDDTVSPGTAERIRAGVPANTARSYERVWRQYTTWCEQESRTPLPATAATLADYVAHLCDEGKAPSTIEHDMAAISKHHRLAGHPKGVPDTTAANLVLRGYRRESGRRTRKAPPVTRDRLRLMSGACDPATLTGKRDRFLLVVGWALAGRRSELAALRLEDVAVDGDELEILIRTSKTDKDSVGEVVRVPAGEHVDTDPVSLYQAWIDALAELGVDVTAGPLFRPVTQHDRLYRAHTGMAVRADAVHEIVQRAAKRAGLPKWQDYSGHSLRAGFATESANAGIPVSNWTRHGRWNEKSPVALGYVRTADARLDNPVRRLGL